MRKKQTTTINDVYQLMDYLKAVSVYEYNPVSGLDKDRFHIFDNKNIDFTRFGDRGIQTLIEIIETKRPLFIRTNYDESILDEILSQLYEDMRERKINILL